MITKEQTKMMIRDLGEEYINLSAKIDKYQALNLDCCIVADLKDAWNVIDKALEQLHNDLTQFDCDEDEEI